MEIVFRHGTISLGEEICLFQLLMAELISTTGRLWPTEFYHIIHIQINLYSRAYKILSHDKLRKS